MRLMNVIVFLSIPVLSSVFAGCAPQVEVVGAQGREGIDQQFVEGNDCIEASLAENTCIDYASIKQQAYDICLQAGLQLTGLSVKPVDGCDSNFGGSADYQCCAIPPTPPPPVPGVCTNGTVGDGVCIDYVSLKIQAEIQCKEAGSYLTSFTPDSSGGCENETASGANYECCSTAPPPPPPVPGLCTSGTVGNGTCQTLDQFKIGASDACNQSSGGLIDLQIDFGSCSNGEALSGTYVCITGGDYCP